MCTRHTAPPQHEMFVTFEDDLYSLGATLFFILAGPTDSDFCTVDDVTRHVLRKYDKYHHEALKLAVEKIETLTDRKMIVEVGNSYINTLNSKIQFLTRKFNFMVYSS